MINWFQEVLTLPIILAFIIGMGVSQVAAYFINRRRRAAGKPCKDSGFTTVVGVVIVAAMVWVMVATQQARNCAITLNVAVAQEQRIAKIERDALGDLFAKLINIPPEITALSPEDPKRQAYGLQIGKDYVAAVQEAAQQREDNEVNRAAAQRACGRR